MVTPASLPSFRPLFLQIKELIKARLTAGEWKPGEALPSEWDFARYYGVSQGTVRKALMDMTAENLVERFRGRGTFVKSQTREREHSHFFHMVGGDGNKVLPTTKAFGCRRCSADAMARRNLDIADGGRVVVIERLRLAADTPIIFETITVSEDRFPGLADLIADAMPNELYPLYETRYGVRVIRAEERLSAVVATEREARALGIAAGTPLLEVDRIATTFGAAPVEWRRSHCHTKDHHYLSVLY